MSLSLVSSGKVPIVPFAGPAGADSTVPLRWRYDTVLIAGHAFYPFP